MWGINSLEEAKEFLDTLRGHKVKGSWWTPNMHEEAEYYFVPKDSKLISTDLTNQRYEITAINKYNQSQTIALTTDWIIIVDMDKELDNV